MNKFTTALLGLAALAMAAPASAQQDVRFNGYGQWAYGRTNRHHYLGGSEDGDYGQFQFSLAANALPAERLRVSVLAFWGAGDEGEEVQIDYAFAEWTISQAARFRAGRARVPFGAYGELLEVGTARPFFSLARGIYGSAGMVTEFYQGLGLTGDYFGESGWGLQYDVYFGHMNFEDEAGNAAFFLEEEPASGEPVEEEEGIAVNDILGGRLLVHTPVEGLSLGVAGFTGTAPEFNDNRRSGILANLDYLSGSWHVRAEVARAIEANEFSVNSFYSEAAYKVTEHWQLGARYDWADASLADAAIDVSEATSLLDHSSVDFAINYWINPNMVLKATLQFVDGNLFAGPEHAELEEAIANGGLEEKTTLFLFGTQFSF